MAKALTNMKLTKAEVKEQQTLGPAKDGPRYPYGLSLNLDNDTLEKLDMGGLPDVGEGYTLVAQVLVTGVSSNDSDSGKYRSVSLQITDMCLEDGKLGERAAKALYGSGS